MKTTKKLIVLCLALAMGIVAIMPSTFSWYNHNGSHTGDRMRYKKDALPVSAGSITMVTKKYRTDDNELYYDEKGNKEYDGGALTQATVARSKTQYFGTTFTNTGAAPAYVNLYLKDFTNNPLNFIGTLAPSLTYKGISSSVHLANKNFIRVYFQVKDANIWKESNYYKYLVYKTKGGTTGTRRSGSTGTGTISNSNDKNNILGGVSTIYFDLPENTTEFFFAINTSTSASVSDLTNAEPWYRTKTITDVQAEKGYYLTGVADDTTFNAQYATFNIPGGVSVKTYFNTATMAAGQKAYVTLVNGTNFTGDKATYTSSNSKVTINSNTGLATAASSMTTGSTATITTTITGSLGDTTTVTTAVSNPSTLTGAAVSTNIEIPGKTQDEDGNDVNGTAEVVWYIENGSTADCKFTSIYYTK